MGTYCPACGQELPASEYTVETAEQLVLALKERPDRMVHRFNDDSGWGLTYGGRVRLVAVRGALAQGLIHPCYSNAPKDAYWLGRTVDVDATFELRKATGDHSARAYVDA